MNDYDYDLDLDYGIITDAKCATCGDKLAVWESVLCCICEAMLD